jgi:putative oxidoreductase
VMAVFTGIAALIAHQFWQLDGAARTAQHIQFMKNLAIIGGFLYVCVAGPGSVSLDRRGR